MPAISDDEAALIVRALEPYDAYLKATKREDSAYRELTERLRRKQGRAGNYEGNREAEKGLTSGEDLLVELRAERENLEQAIIPRTARQGTGTGRRPG